MSTLNFRQWQLLGAAALLTPFAILAATVLNATVSPLAGYLALHALYWVCFCIPAALRFGGGATRVSLAPRLAGPWWVPASALGLPLAVLFVGGALSPAAASVPIVALALATAAINGPLEELAWRRTFRANSNGALSFELAGLALFTLWHLSLLMLAGVRFDGGGLALVGGAFGLGLAWLLMTRRTNSVGWRDRRESRPGIPRGCGIGRRPQGTGLIPDTACTAASRRGLARSIEASSEGQSPGRRRG